MIIVMITAQWRTISQSGISDLNVQFINGQIEGRDQDYTGVPNDTFFRIEVLLAKTLLIVCKHVLG